MGLMGERNITVLDEFIIQREKDFPYATGELSALLRHIGLAAKIVNRSVNQAGLIDILGKTGNSNVHGEEVKQLDVYANERFLESLRLSGLCCGIGSEENEKPVIPEDYEGSSKYIVAIDPLDGSSNIDVNVSIGTIFSIYRSISAQGECLKEDFLQQGHRQVASGYIVYGSSTMLVYTTGNGVNGFTLDPSIGEFCLSHPDIRVPENGSIYSINVGNYNKFSEGVRNYIDYCQEVDKETKRPYKLRYIGSMVADIHRTLINGGIFLYPASKGSPEGKLRLLYESNPMAYLIEQAGGKATDGNGNRILDLNPKDLHQKSPIFIGSSNMVEKAEEMNLKASAEPVEEIPGTVKSK